VTDGSRSGRADAMSGQKAALLVVGAHRSGTSATARVLNLLGCDLPRRLIEANPTNPAGHWEPREVVALNVEILASSGAAWDDWSVFDRAWYASPVAQGFRARARAVLEGAFADSRLFVLKDPRLCRLLPFWLEAVRAFGAAPFVVSPIRNPLDVALSLEERDGIDPSIGHLIWLRYVLDAEKASREVKRAYLRYETLLSRPHAAANALGTALGISWPKHVSTEGRMEIDEFLSSDLHHHRADDEALLTSPALSRWTVSSFEIFDRWCRGETRAGDTGKLGRIRAAFDAATPAFARAVAAGRRAVRKREGEIAVLERGVAERDGRIVELSAALSAREGEVAGLERTVEEHARALALLYASRSWRVTAPLRFPRRLWQASKRLFLREARRLKEAAFRSRANRRLIEWLFSILHRHPELIPVARRASYLLPSGIAIAIRRYHYKWKNSSSFPSHTSLVKQHIRHRIRRKRKAIDLETLRSYSMKGQLTKGWYGGRELRQEETFLATESPPQEILILAEDAYQAGTQEIGSRYLAHRGRIEEAPPYLRCAPLGEFRRFLGEKLPPDCVAEMPGCGGFTVVTPFHRHLDFFRNAAASVDLLFSAEEVERTTVEWLVVNDDPAISSEEIAEHIPKRLRSTVRHIRPDGAGGIVDALNSGIRCARHRWLLFLDCDDEIESNAITVLNHYIGLFPRCRYISSSMTDIDEKGAVLRFRGNEHPIDRLFDIGMLAGHLKMIRRDLFDDIGYLDPRFNLCQDCEFALRTAMHEPILKIPEPLYRYRWHEKTQSTSHANRQKTIHDRIQREYLHRFLDLREEVKPDRKKAESQAVHRPTLHPRTPLLGAIIVRTQNKRPKLLREAVESIAVQASALTPVVVVHGSDRDLHNVELQLRSMGDVVLLHACEERKPNKRLGYPANVALDYIAERPGRFDYITFLDDDDIIYPFFSQEMDEALEWSSADIVYAMSNRRWPWRAAEPGPVPLPASCLIAENFIPCNAYCLATSFLCRCDIRFDENTLYLDDWDFLLSLWNAGARFHFVPKTVSEFRITNDGNTVEKKYPKLYAQAAARMQEKAWNIAVSREGGLTRFWRDVLDFEWLETRMFNEHTVDLAHGIWLKAEQHRNARRREGRPQG